MVSKFATKLCKPEEIIISNFEDKREMYIIAKGECSAIMLDE